MLRSGPKDPAVDPRMLERILSGDFRSVARLLTWVENEIPAATAYLRELFSYTGRCFVAGVTGPPGSGKSTLVDRLAAYYRVSGKRLGILAVDPTSPFSGAQSLETGYACSPVVWILVHSSAAWRHAVTWDAWPDRHPT